MRKQWLHILIESHFSEQEMGAGQTQRDYVPFHNYFKYVGTDGGMTYAHC
jgi:hypothetical protein